MTLFSPLKRLNGRLTRDQECGCCGCPGWQLRNLDADFTGLANGIFGGGLNAVYPQALWSVVSDNGVTQNGYSTVNGTSTPEVYDAKLRFQRGGVYTGGVLIRSENFNPNLSAGPSRFRWTVDYSTWATSGAAVDYFIEMRAASQRWPWTTNEANVGDDARFPGAIPTEWSIFDIGATKLYGSASDNIFTDASIELGFDMQKTGSDATNIIYNGDWTIDGDIKYSESFSILKSELSCAYQFIFHWTQNVNFFSLKYDGGYDLDNISVTLTP